MSNYCAVCGRTFARPSDSLRCSCANLPANERPIEPYDPDDYPAMREVDWQEMLNPDEGDKG